MNTDKFFSAAFKRRYIKYLIIFPVLIACLIGVLCFFIKPKPPQTEADKTKAYTLKVNASDLVSAREGFVSAYDCLSALPDSYSPDLFSKLATINDGQVVLYGLRNGASLIIQDGENLYPVFMKWYVAREVLPEIYKADYDGDGDFEYAIYSLQSAGSNCTIMQLTMVEVAGGNVETLTYDTSAIFAAHAASKYAEYFCGDFVYYEERDGVWWAIVPIGTKDNAQDVSINFSANMALEVPLTYCDTPDGKTPYFETGSLQFVQ